MNGFCGIFSETVGNIDEFAFIKSINLADTMQVQSVTSKDSFLATSFLESAPLKGSRIYKTGSLIILFTGDLIDYKEIPWSDIEANFSKSNLKWFSTLRGFFAFAIFDKKLKQLFLISDCCAQIPVYYGYIKNNFIFSTDISTFTTLKYVPDFNIKWLYESIFFNFPIDRTTCLKKVYRLRSISILNFNLISKETRESRYGELFKSSKNILTGKEAWKKSIKTIKETVPKYYSDNKVNLVALTSGFDSRTLLSLAPQNSGILTYTYGIEGSFDLSEASKLSNRLNIEHKKIHFDNNFLKSLPNLIYETVRLSGGVQSILRSSLSYIYKLLYNEKNTSIVIGGIGGDSLRGGGANLSVIPKGLDNYFQTGKPLIDNDVSQNIFGTQYNMFEHHVYSTLEKIKKTYGDPVNPMTRMSFDYYETNPKYFGGEVALASNYLTLRLPFLDHDIINLTYTTQYGAHTLSPYIHKKHASYKKYVFQSKIINTNSNFKKTYIHGMPLSLYANDNKLLFQVCRPFIRGYDYIKGYRSSKTRLEDWDVWFKDILNKEFDNLLNHNSLILDYVNKDFITSVKKSNNLEMLSKLATTEILLNLIKNKWNIYSNKSNFNFK